MNQDIYITRDHEAGNEIESFDTLQEALEAIEKYIETDKVEGNYTENFYEVYNIVTKEIELTK